MKITAKLLEIQDINQISSTFKKREFIVEYSENPKYPEFIKFELIQDKCDLLNRYSTGQELEIHFNLKGRKWNDSNGNTKYFNSLQAWKVGIPADVNATGSNRDTGFESDAPPSWLDQEDNSDQPF